MDLTLEEVKEAFKEWRGSRRYLGEKIPEALWEKVKALTLVYDSKVIRRTLNLNVQQFRREGLEESRVVEKKQNLEEGFVSALLPAFSSCELRLEKCDKVLTLKIEASSLEICLPLLVNAL